MSFPVLDRYVYRQMFPVFVIAVSVFTFLHVMDRLQDFSNMAVNGAPLYLVFQLWALLLLSFVSHTLPLGLLRPFLVAALAVALTVATLTIWINPWGSAAFFQCLRELRQHAAMPMIQEQTFTRIGNIVVYTDEMDLSTSELRGVLIVDERDPKTFGIITAPHGRLIDDEPNQRTILRLTDGAVHESRPESPAWYRVTKFEVYETPLDMATQIAEVEKEAGAQKKLTTWDLVLNTRALDYSRRAEKAEMFVVEFHKRLSLPLAPIVFAM